MKNKIIIILIITILIISSLFIIYNTIYLDYKSDIVMELIGEEDINLPVFDEYKEEGIKASFRDKDIKDKVEIKSDVDTNKIGEYKITYTIDYKKKHKELKRIIHVLDTIEPTLTLEGDTVTLYVGDEYNDPGYKAVDNYDGDITSSVKVDTDFNNKIAGNYTLTYSVSDSSGNSISKTRNIIVKNKIVSQGIAVLNYHFFYSDFENCNQGICLNTKKLEEQFKYLNDNGYKTLTMEEFRAWMYGEIELPKKSVLLTIDDGAMGTGIHNGNKLIPLLEKYQIHATLFLITGWWDINNYRSSYLDIESHTYDMHTEGLCSNVTRGAKMLCSSYEDAVNDLKKSIEITGSNTAFCYPFYAYNDQAINEVKEAGFKLAFAGGSVKATRNSNKYAIPRYPIYNNITLSTFISYIS